MSPGNHMAEMQQCCSSHLGSGRALPANATPRLCVLVTLRAPPAITPFWTSPPTCPVPLPPGKPLSLQQVASPSGLKDPIPQQVRIPCGFSLFAANPPPNPICCPWNLTLPKDADTSSPLGGLITQTWSPYGTFSPTHNLFASIPPLLCPFARLSFGCTNML